MAQSGSVECEYLVDGEFCKSIIGDEEGKTTRQKWCLEAVKNLCCYLCARRESCEISCSYLNKPSDSQSKSQTSMSIDREIEECKKRIDRLAVLLADGKIGEQSYAAATRTLENRMESLKRAKENPNVLLSSSTGVERFEDASFERPTLLWYLVPFFFGIIGGLVGYVGVKDEGPDNGRQFAGLRISLDYYPSNFLLGSYNVTAFAYYRVSEEQASHIEQKKEKAE